MMADNTTLCICGIFMCFWLGLTLLIIGTVLTATARRDTRYSSGLAIAGPILLALGALFTVIDGILICCFRKHQAEQNQNREPVVVTTGTQPVGFASVPMAGYGPSQSQYPSAYPAPQPTAPPVQGLALTQEETTFTDRRKHEDDMAPPSYASVMKNS